ncbi:MAG: endonuclease/exonuclease/phosphatase family protein [Akkermansia muciniphila]
MSYNVKNGTGMDGRRDYDRTARVIAEEKPDVVALQELDQGTIRSGGRDTLQELAARTTLTGTYAKAIDYSGGSYGVGILSREKPLSVKRIPCPAGGGPCAVDGRVQGLLVLRHAFVPDQGRQQRFH